MGLDVGVAITPDEARECIVKKVGYQFEERTGCWIWPVTASTGFGPFLAFYEAAYGPAPKGFEVKHLCHSGDRGCVRPSHLDVVPIGSKLAKRPDPALSVEERLSFAARIRDERTARRATRAAFAKELGIAASTMRDWEEGHSQPTGDTYRQLAKKLGWSGHRRKFRVTVIHERIIQAHSAGEAVREFYDELDIEGEPLKTEVVAARVVA
jgi:transcriptional regulator with XRE-family HTH domain